MLSVSHFFEQIDLRSIHWIASFIGVFLCIYAMQMWSTGLIGDIEKCVSVNGLRRAALWVLALAFLWSLGYADLHSTWQPWPPDLLVILAVDLFLTATIIGGYIRRQQGARAAG